VSGAINSEFSIDGSSNVGSQARVAIQPPADSIQEFKVDTAVYDAQVGHTGAGAVNLALKSGTNDFHGAVSFYNRDDSRSANLFASNARGDGKTPRNYNRFSATLTGPIVRNKTFFMLSYEKLQDDTVETVTGFVPTEKMRRGDFSEFLPLGIQIYDPRTARLVNGQVTRDPFPGNIIPASRINPVARNVLAYYPLPNQAGAADLTGNFFAEQPWTYGYDFQMVRLDQNWTDNQRTVPALHPQLPPRGALQLGGRAAGHRHRARGHGPLQLQPRSRAHLGALALALPRREGQLPALQRRPGPGGVGGHARPGHAGLLRGYGAALPRLQPHPDVQHGRERGLPGLSQHRGTRPSAWGGNQNGFNSGREQPFYNLQVAPTLTKVWGGHNVKAGYDWRSLRQNEVNEGFRGGQFRFDSTYTRQSGNSTGRFGQGVAAFMLGLPTSSSFIETRSTQSYEVISHGFFIHDDWRLGSKLTLEPRPALRPRAGHDGEPEPQHARLRPHDPEPHPGPGPGQLRGPSARGRAPHRQPVRRAGRLPVPRRPAAPRLGRGQEQRAAAARLHLPADSAEPAARRSGLFVAPFQITGVPGIGNPINQIGYSRNTPVTITTDNGLTFIGDLTRPVPSGALLEPVGSSQGLLTNLGASLGSRTTAGFIPTERSNPQFWRFTFGIERELPGQWLVELTYLGQRGRTSRSSKR
jgi:hypothetical protein